MKRITDKRNCKITKIWFKQIFTLFAAVTFGAGCSKNFPDSSLFDLFTLNNLTGGASMTPAPGGGGGGGGAAASYGLILNTAFVVTYEDPAVPATTINIKLSSAPTAPVTIPVTSSNTAEGTIVAPATGSLTFTPANWNTTQPVTVQGTDDFVVDTNTYAPYTVILGIMTSTDPNYNGVDPADAAAVNVDNDTVTIPAKIHVMPSSALKTSENLTTDQFGVILQTAPTGTVTILLSSAMPSEGTVTLPASGTLTFNAANWNTPQIVEITGVDDSIADGPVPYTITLDPTTSTDAVYKALAPVIVNASNDDNDTVGVTLSKTSVVTSEATGGTTDFFTIKLNSAPAPTQNATIVLASTIPGEATVLAPTTLTFTDVCPGVNCWSTPQTVTIQGVDDTILDGTQPYSITLNLIGSTDPTYAAYTAPSVSGSNLDDEVASIVVTGGPLTTDEAGTLAPTFTVALTAAPTLPVTVPIVSSDTTEATVTPASLTFDTTCPGPTCWSTPHTVTVNGVDDFIVDGPSTPYTILVQPATGTDPYYAGINPPDVTGNNNDNDAANITLYDNPPAGLLISEAGVVDGFALVLNSQPTSPVTISANVPATLPLHQQLSLNGTIWAASVNVVFTPSNWYIPQNVLVASVQDTTIDRLPTAGEPTFNVSFTVSSLDGNYNLFALAPLAGINVEDEKYIYVTAATHNANFDNDVALKGGTYGAVNGDFDGIQEADNFCMLDVNMPAAAGYKYKALLVDNTVRRASVTANMGDSQKSWVLTPSTNYYRSADQLKIFTTNTAGIYTTFPAAGAFTTTISTTWTGLNANWTSSSTCGYWATISVFFSGMASIADSTTSAMISGGTALACTSAQKLICVQQ